MALPFPWHAPSSVAFDSLRAMSLRVLALLALLNLLAGWAFLSGSGPTVLALTMGREMTVAYEMAEAARQASVEAEVKVTKPIARGAHVVDGGETRS